MKKRNIIKKISRKTMLIAAVSVIALAAVGTAYGLQLKDKGDKPSVAQSMTSNTDTASLTPTQETQTVSTASPATADPTPTPEPTPTPPTNPYQEGFNLWHVYNRRTAVGKPMPTDTNGGEAYVCTQIVKKTGYTSSKTPTQHAIACMSQTLGFVEKVNPDGSIVVSFTNYTSGWNKYVEVTFQPADFGQIRTFIQ